MTAGQLESGYHRCYDQFYREVDRDRALFDGFRGRVMKAFIRAGRNSGTRNPPRRDKIDAAAAGSPGGPPGPAAKKQTAAGGEG
jgi:hypothetical protein